MIPKLKKGTLTQFGYSTKSSDRSRHIALNKAIKKLTESTVIHKLNALKVLTKNKTPTLSKLYDSDIKWIHSKNK